MAEEQISNHFTKAHRWISERILSLGEKDLSGTTVEQWVVEVTQLPGSERSHEESGSAATSSVAGQCE